MARTSILGAAVLVAALLGSSTAEAQWVRVGPFGGVRVRAPFVGVDVMPFGGGTRVRAPFTRVDTGLYRYGYGYGYGVPRYGYGYGSYRFGYGGYGYGAYRYGYPNIYTYRGYFPSYSLGVPSYRLYGARSYRDPGYVYPRPDNRSYDLNSLSGDLYQSPRYLSPTPSVDEREIVPTPRGTREVYEAARPDSQSGIESQLRDAALRLQRSLNQRGRDADVWLDYLAPSRILTAIDEDRDPQSLKDLLANYDGVLANGSLGWVRSLPGFSETRRLLQQFINPSPTSL